MIRKVEELDGKYKFKDDHFNFFELQALGMEGMIYKF